MSKLLWDQTGEKIYETGVDHGILFPTLVTTANSNNYATGGKAWNGLTAVNESPSGAEAEKIYADNIVYLTLTSAEEYSATIEAYTYPDEFADCNGETQAFAGVTFGQQARKTFGFVFRTIKGNDVDGDKFGYELHLLYGLKASPSSKDHSTVNDSPEAVQMSWEVNSTPVAFTTNTEFKPVSTIVIDSTKVDAVKYAQFEDLLNGVDANTAARYVKTNDKAPVEGKTYYYIDPDDGTWKSLGSGESFDAGTVYYQQVPAVATAADPVMPTPQYVYDFFKPATT